MIYLCKRLSNYKRTTMKDRTHGVAVTRLPNALILLLRYQSWWVLLDSTVRNLTWIQGKSLKAKPWTVPVVSYDSAYFPGRKCPWGTCGDTVMMVDTTLISCFSLISISNVAFVETVHAYYIYIYIHMWATAFIYFDEKNIWRLAGFEQILVSPAKRDQNEMGGLQKRDRFWCLSYSWTCCCSLNGGWPSKIGKPDHS